MASALTTSMTALMMLASSTVPWGVGAAGTGSLSAMAASGVLAHIGRCRPLSVGIAGASTLWNDDEVDRFTHATGVDLHYVHGFVRLGDDLPITGIVEAESRGAEAIVSLEPWFFERVADRPLRRMADGEFDRRIRSTAKRFASLDAEPIVRFGHEMNGIWYPWGRTGNEPQDYVDAFRHLVAVFESEGASNVRWLWSPNAVVAGNTPLAEYYPGDDVVDLLGFGGYNGGLEVPAMGGWTSPTAALEPTLLELETLSDKPILLAETASARRGGDRGQWVADLVALLRRHPRVIGFVWFEVAKEADWRLADDPTTIRQLVLALEGCPPNP